MMINNNYNVNNIKRGNPYSPQHPASPEYFANRSDELNYFREATTNCARLRPPAPMNFIVLGDWGIGKTSLLYKMEQIVLKELAKKFGAFCFHFSLDPICCKDWNGFCLVFLNQLKKNYAVTTGLSQRLRSELSKWKISFTLPPITVKRERPPETSFFIDELEGLWKKHLQPSGIDIAFLFLDDIHYFLQVGQSDAYFALRNIFQELPRRNCNFSLVLSGPKLLFTQIVDLAEPFVRFFHPFYLEPFNLEGTREAILKRIAVNRLELNVSEAVISDIHEKTRGHPYFVMFTMYELLNAIKGKKEINKDGFDKNWASILSMLEKTIFSGHFNGASTKEKDVILRISKLDEEIVSPSMIKGVKGAPVLFSRLERKGLIIKRERGKYEVFHPLFRDYLRKMSNS